MKKIIQPKLDPRVDIVFKKTFGVEENKDLLISLINSIVSDQDRVKDLIIKNPYNNKSFKADKLSILDIKAQGENGRVFNVEMQVTDEANYDKRALYYWAKAYADQIGNQGAYSNLYKTIGIHILSFLSVPESPKYHNIFKIKERDLNIEKFKNMELHTIELSKFSEKDGTDIAKIAKKVKTNLDRWATFFTNYELLLSEDLPKNLDDVNLKKAAHIVEVMSFSRKERDLYENRLQWLRLEEDALNKRFDEGIKEGVEKGIKEGEKRREIEIAKKMVSKNKPIEEIIEFTGLSKEAIKSFL